MRKISKVLISFVLILSMFLAACSNDSASGNDSKEEEKVVLDVTLWDENISDVMDKLEKDFEESHENVDVKVTYTPWSDYWTKLRTSLAGGKGPDLFWMNSIYLPQYASSGMVKNIQPLIDEEGFDTSVYYDALTELYSLDGDLHGMPLFLDSIALFYNKKLFDEAGLSYPDETWTWEDIEEAGAKLTNKDQGVYGYIAQTGEAQKQYFNTIPQAGGYMVNEERTKSGFDTPETLAAFQWMQKLIDEGISPTAQMQAETAPDQLFGSGKAAMIQLISVNAESMYDLLGDDLGIAPLPKGKERAVSVNGISWAMNANTEKEELAWELMKALSDRTAGEYVAESGFSIPAFKGSEGAWVESIPELELQVFIDSLEYGVPFPTTQNVLDWFTVMGEEVQKAFFGQKPMEEALQAVADSMNKALAEENE